MLKEMLELEEEMSQLCPCRVFALWLMAGGSLGGTIWTPDAAGSAGVQQGGFQHHGQRPGSAPTARSPYDPVLIKMFGLSDLFFSSANQ